MAITKIYILALLISVCTFSSCALDKPNIIFILLDDLGKEWISCYGAEDIQTPHIDRLAESGIQFSNVYSMPQCTPSRVCFLTGQYPFRNGWVNHWDVPRWGLGYFDWKMNPSVGRIMKTAGYKTAIAGKWQINDFRIHPNALVKHGFDDFCMWTGGETDPSSEHHTIISDKRYWDPYIHTKDGSKSYPGKFGPDIYNQFILDFISNNKDNPFFIYYPMTLPHGPLVHTPLHMNAESKLDKHKAMVNYIDYLLGKVVTHLRDLQLSERTLIVFTSDNGTAGNISNNRNGMKVKGGKMKTTENGVNTPFIVSWPGHILDNQKSDALIDFSDLLPTFSELAGATLETGYTYDGISVVSTFLNPQTDTSRNWILAMGSHPAKGTVNGIENTHTFRDRVIRGKKYKLFIGVDGKPQKLIDLSKDISESNNLLQSRSHQNILDLFNEVLSDIPKKDNDPIYKRILNYPVYREGSIPSHIHKK
ncbi:MAG: sulfatase-like hydrolase/transferase [Pontiellaceae bacterium]